MSAYIVIRITVNDPIKLKEYQQVAPSIIESFGGKLLARGGEVASLEGPAENRRVVIIEFPSMEKAKRFYHSPAYTQAIKLRIGVADFELIAVEGIS